MPLKLYSLEGRYATALYSAATKANTLTALEAELLRISKALEKSPAMLTTLNDPSLSRLAKKTQVTTMLTENKYSPMVVNFFNVLADYGRFASVSKIITAFEEIMKAHRKEVELIVTSAKVMEH